MPEAGEWLPADMEKVKLCLTYNLLRAVISADGSNLKGYELKSNNEIIESSMSNVYFSYGWRTGFKGTTYSLTVYGTGGYSGNLSGNITVG